MFIYGVYNSEMLAKKVTKEVKENYTNYEFTIYELLLETDDDHSKEFHAKYGDE